MVSDHDSPLRKRESKYFGFKLGPCVQNIFFFLLLEEDLVVHQLAKKTIQFLLAFFRILHHL